MDYNSLPRFTHPDQQGAMEDFFRHYNIQSMFSCPSVPNKIWIPKSSRRCRFCALSMPDTSFRHDAHFIPEFLGNKYLIFQQECDACNSHFSGLESDMSAFLGPLLSIYSRSGKKNKVPKFKGSNNSPSAIPKALYGAQITEVENQGTQVMELDPQTGEGRMKFTKSTYTPLNVYKTLCKIAVNALPDDEIPDYQCLITFLLSNKMDANFKLFARVIEYSLPMELPRPEVRIFKRLKEDKSLPFHICHVYFGNMMYQFILPGNIKDHYMQGGIELTPKFCPPFHFVDFKVGSFFPRTVDLSNNEKLKNEEVAFILNINPEDLKDLKAYDTINNKYTDRKFNPGEIVKIYFGKMGTALEFPESAD